MYNKQLTDLPMSNQLIITKKKRQFINKLKFTTFSLSLICWGHILQAE